MSRMFIKVSGESSILSSSAKVQVNGTCLLHCFSNLNAHSRALEIWLKYRSIPVPHPRPVESRSSREKLRKMNNFKDSHESIIKESKKHCLLVKVRVGKFFL